MTDDRPTARSLISNTLRELASEAETLLLAALALEDKATGIPNHSNAQTLREVATVVRGTALQVGLTVVGVIGKAERLLVLADLDDTGSADEAEAPGK